MNNRIYFFQAFDSCPRPDATQIFRTAIEHKENDLFKLLITKTSEELTLTDIRTQIEGYLWMLTPKTFRYFLPAFMNAALENYKQVSVFASELIDALTKPVRNDITESLQQITQSQNKLGLPNELIKELSKQQLEWFDSGTPLAVFYERVKVLTPPEGNAILTFLNKFEKKYGADFPFEELKTAIERHWFHYK